MRAVHYDPSSVALGRVLAPPYDVISPELQRDLYGRDPHNFVRIEFGLQLEGDRPGERDRYTRAAEYLSSWLSEGVLKRDVQASLYISDHEFRLPQGQWCRRRGLFTRLPALPWERAQIRPHERTRPGPKQDRLCLMRATRMQTSPVFGLWDGSPRLTAVLEEVAEAQPPLAHGECQGEIALERHTIWAVSDAAARERILGALEGAELYVADGHHRYETAVAYAAERRAEDPGLPAGQDSDYCLVYLCAANDPSVIPLPTHRLLLPLPGLPDSLHSLAARLEGAFEIRELPTFEAAMAEARQRHRAEHAFAVVTRDGAGVVSRRRDPAAGQREALDVVVLDEELLPQIRRGAADAGDCLGYTRDADDLESSVHNDEAVLGFALNAFSTADIIAVSRQGESMPPKSTYFYPKVPAGLVLLPV